MERINTAERRRRLGARHHLSGPAPSLETIASDLAGVHATDPASVVMGFRSRMATGFDAATLERALYDDRTLLRVLGMRRTMFVAPRRLAAVVDAACAVDMVAPQRRRVAGWIEEQGLATDGAEWINTVEEATLAALRRGGPATAAELKKEVPELNEKLTFPTGTMGMSTRILFLLATEGRIVRGRPRGTWRSSMYEWAPMDGWVEGGLGTWEPAEAHAELLRTWLGAFGPATLTDAKWWTGWTVSRTRTTLAAVGAVEVALDDGGTAHVLPDDVEPTPQPEPWVALLPALDTTIMGWKERDWFLGAYAPRLFDRNGNAGPAIWLNGAVVGGWAHRADGQIVTEMFEDIGEEMSHRVACDADELATWLGDHRVVPRFRTPTEKQLSS